MIWGADDFPRFTVGLILLFFPLIVAPNLALDLTGGRGRLAVRVVDGHVVLDEFGAYRFALAGLAAICVALPFIARWESTSRDFTPTFLTRTFIWVLPVFGVAGLIWVARAKRTAMTLTQTGIVLQDTSKCTELSWAVVPAFTGQPEPRLLRGLMANGTPFPVYQLRSDPAIVADILDYYRTHPQDRREIGTAAFLDRLRRDAL